MGWAAVPGPGPDPGLAGPAAPAGPAMAAMAAMAGVAAAGTAVAADAGTSMSGQEGSMPGMAEAGCSMAGCPTVEDLAKAQLQPMGRGPPTLLESPCYDWHLSPAPSAVAGRCRRCLGGEPSWPAPCHQCCGRSGGKTCPPGHCSPAWPVSALQEHGSTGPRSLRKGDLVHHLDASKTGPKPSWSWFSPQPKLYPEDLQN